MNEPADNIITEAQQNPDLKYGPAASRSFDAAKLSVSNGHSTTSKGNLIRRWFYASGTTIFFIIFIFYFRFQFQEDDTGWGNWSGLIWAPALTIALTLGISWILDERKSHKPQISTDIQKPFMTHKKIVSLVLFFSISLLILTLSWLTSS